jgi:hypothetical protein
MSIRRYWRPRYIIPAAIIGAPVALAVFIAVGGGIVMLLWNWLLPPLFGWPQITIWQGFGLLALCRILFGGLGRGGHRSRHFSQEDRERFRERMRERFGKPSMDSPPSSGGVI